MNAIVQACAAIRALVVVVATAVLCVAPAGAQQFTMKLSTPTINDATTIWMEAFKAGVEKRSNGRIKIEIYPANQLGQIPATVDGVALGTIEMTTPAVGFFVGLEPRFQTLDAAGLFDSIEHGEKVLNDPEIRKRLATFGSAKNVEPLFTFVNGPLMVLSHKPIHGLADFAGQKIRVPGSAPLQIEPFKKLGVSPIALPLGEALPAMQNKSIDGVIAAFTIFTAFKYYDVAKEITYLPGSFLIASGLVNRNFMKSLGPELEAIVRDEAQKYQDLFSTRGVEDLQRIRSVWEKNGGKIVTMSPDQAKAYLETVTAVVPAVVDKNPEMKADYEALLEAAKKYRQQ